MSEKIQRGKNNLLKINLTANLEEIGTLFFFVISHNQQRVFHE